MVDRKEDNDGTDELQPPVRNVRPKPLDGDETGNRSLPTFSSTSRSSVSIAVGLPAFPRDEPSIARYGCTTTSIGDPKELYEFRLPSYEFSLSSYNLTQPSEDDGLSWNFIRHLRIVLLAARGKGYNDPFDFHHNINSNCIEKQCITPAEVDDEVFLSQAVSFVEFCRKGGHVKLDVAFRHRGCFTEGWLYARHMETSSRQPGLKVRAPGAIVLAKFTKKQNQDNDHALKSCLDSLMESIHVVLTHCLAEFCTVLPLTTYEEHLGSKRSSAGSEIRLAIERSESLKMLCKDFAPIVDEALTSRNAKDDEETSCAETEIIDDDHENDAFKPGGCNVSCAEQDISESIDETSCAGTELSDETTEFDTRNNPKQRCENQNTRTSSRGSGFKVLNLVGKAARYITRSLTSIGTSRRSQLLFNPKARMC